MFYVTNSFEAKQTNKSHKQTLLKDCLKYNTLLMRKETWLMRRSPRGLILIHNTHFFFHWWMYTILLLCMSINTIKLKMIGSLLLFSMAEINLDKSHPQRSQAVDSPIESPSKHMHCYHGSMVTPLHFLHLSIIHTELEHS